MAIDPRIAMSFQAPQIASPMDLAQNAFALKGAMQQNALAEAKMAEMQRQQQSQNALRQLFAGGKMPDAAAVYAVDPTAGAEFEQRRAEIGRAQAAAAASDAERAGRLYKNKSEMWTDFHNLISGAVDEPSYQQNLAQAKTRGFDVSQAPPHFDPNWVANAGRAVLTVKERAEEADRAATRTETGRHNRAMEKAAEGKGVDINSYPHVYQAVADGRIPLSRVNSRTAAIFEGVLARNPDADLNAIGLDQTSATAGARTAGATQANISIASDEANRMIGVTRGLIPKINATDFPSLNAIKNAIDKGTGGPDIVALNTSLNSLINSYARAINPKGVATVSDKNHARDLINSAMSEGQLDAALNVMQLEMETALGAARAGSGRQKPAEATAPAVSLPAAAAAQLKEGVNTTFGNGQTWTLQNGKPAQVK